MIHTLELYYNKYDITSLKYYKIISAGHRLQFRFQIIVQIFEKERRTPPVRK